MIDRIRPKILRQRCLIKLIRLYINIKGRPSNLNTNIAEQAKLLLIKFDDLYKYLDMLVMYLGLLEAAKEIKGDIYVLSLTKIIRDGISHHGQEVFKCLDKHYH